MEVEIGIEHLRIEAVDGSGVFLRDVAVAHGLAHDRAVLAFGERVVVGMTRARFGEFDAEFLKHSCGFIVDVLGSGVGMETPNCPLVKRKYRYRLITVVTKVRRVDSSAGLEKATSVVPFRNSWICSIVSRLDTFISITMSR